MANELVVLTRYGGLSPDEIWNARTPVTPEEREHFKKHFQKEGEDGLRKMWAELKDTATDKEREEALAKTERGALHVTQSAGRWSRPGDASTMPHRTKEAYSATKKNADF